VRQQPFRKYVLVEIYQDAALFGYSSIHSDPHMLSEIEILNSRFYNHRKNMKDKFLSPQENRDGFGKWSAFCGLRDILVKMPILGSMEQEAAAENDLADDKEDLSWDICVSFWQFISFYTTILSIENYK
ncbi:hypothetical protein ACJX0J_015876, partial [Zea mays]